MVVYKYNFVGIVAISNSDLDGFVIAILNSLERKVYTKKFFFNCFDFISDDSSSNLFTKNTESPTLRAAKRFLSLHVKNKKSARVLFEVPQIFPQPNEGDKDSKETYSYNRPCAVIEKSSLYSHLIFNLAAEGYMALPCSFRDEDKNVLVTTMSFEAKYQPWRHCQALCLGQNIAKAYTEFFLQEDPDIEKIALVAAIICKNKGSYAYWSSFGLVQSLQDIMNGFRQKINAKRMKENSELVGMDMVYSAGDMYSLLFTTGTKFNEIDRIPLKYGVALQKSQSFQKPDSLKISLAKVCKDFSVHLACSRVDELQKSGFVIVQKSVASEKNTYLLSEEEFGFEDAVFPLACSDEWINVPLRDEKVGTPQIS